MLNSTGLGPVGETSQSLQRGRAFLLFRTTPATIYTIANTAAMLNFGQERSRENAALAVEPCCAPILLLETGHSGQAGIPKRSLIVGAL